MLGMLSLQLQDKIVADAFCSDFAFAKSTNIPTNLTPPSKKSASSVFHNEQLNTEAQSSGDTVHLYRVSRAFSETHGLQKRIYLHVWRAQTMILRPRRIIPDQRRPDRL